MNIKQGRILSGLLGVLLLQAFTLMAAPTVTKIAAGGAHSLFIKSDGSLWGTGRQLLWRTGCRLQHLQHQQAVANRSWRRLGDCGRILSQPLSAVRRQSVGHGSKYLRSVGRR